MHFKDSRSNSLLYFEDTRSKFFMGVLSKKMRKRGRPSMCSEELASTRVKLIQAGVELLTKKGFASAGIEEILSLVQVPKGSFYHYFESKEAFGIVLIKSCFNNFDKRLDTRFSKADFTPIEQTQDFILIARANMKKYNFSRGCLVGNLGQEMAVLPNSFRKIIIGVLNQWQFKTASFLRRAQETGEIALDLDCDALAAAFWIGWEDAILRTKLERSADPIDLFVSHYFQSIGISEVNKIFK
jgi:TetR/AcrR family transcriptional repressor of nem operon